MLHCCRSVCGGERGWFWVGFAWLAYGETQHLGEFLPKVGFYLGFGAVVGSLVAVYYRIMSKEQFNNFVARANELVDAPAFTLLNLALSAIVVVTAVRLTIFEVGPPPPPHPTPPHPPPKPTRWCASRARCV